MRDSKINRFHLVNSLIYEYKFWNIYYCSHLNRDLARETGVIFKINSKWQSSHNIDLEKKLFTFHIYIYIYCIIPKFFSSKRNAIITNNQKV